MPNRKKRPRPAEFQTALLAWYRREARPLPWRAAPTLYKTVVSEFMLQQTQVKTVLPYFERWMRELPHFAALAEAPPGRVLQLWEGLGYYTRARNLQALARALTAMPETPQTAEGWDRLPGVGPYTAAAISSIAFGARAACVDGNVVRILARLSGDPTEFRDGAEAARILAPLAEHLLSADRPGDHNQAMMELGATVCFKRKPNCLICPVRPFCAAAAAGEPEPLPRLRAKASERMTVRRVWCTRGGSLLLHRAPHDARRLAALHELPTAEQAGISPADLAALRLIARKKRGITRFRITEWIYEAPPPGGRLDPQLSWVPIAKLGSIALSGPHRRWVTEILASSQEKTL